MSWLSLHRAWPAVVLVASLVALNLLAVFGLASSLREVRAALREQRSLELRADARAFESLLAQLHADLSFLASSGALPRGSRSLAEVDDPVRRRWTRLDLQAALLLFLQSHPAARRLELELEGRRLHMIAGRIDGVPQLLPPGSEPPHARLLRDRWTVGDDGGVLRAWVDPVPISDLVGKTFVVAETGSTESVAEPVASDLWTPALRGWLVGSAEDGGVVRSVEGLASRTRWILFLNLALLPLILVLATYTLREVRRVARLEAEAAHRRRLAELEQQVRHADRLASLGRFAAGIAHEINNPLEGMANYLELLDDDLRQRPDEARRWVPRLREGVERAAGTVRQVLRFANPGPSEKGPVDLVGVVRRTLDFLGGHPDCREVQVIAELPEELVVHGNAQTLGQLVLNLVLNASQAQSGGGTVTVEMQSHVDHVELLVLDRGPGFPDEILEHPFEPFQSTRDSLGMGLAVCHGIVLDHEGEIVVEPRDDGRGSCVRVVLPLQQPLRQGEVEEDPK